MYIQYLLYFNVMSLMRAYAIAVKLALCVAHLALSYYYYSYEDLDEICLSDTCGTLSFYDFRFIMEHILGRNINMKKISLHLHNQPNNPMNLKNIIIYAMKCGIYRFDVSNMPDIGGCSVTMDKTNGNLSYEQVIDCV